MTLGFGAGLAVYAEGDGCGRAGHEMPVDVDMCLYSPWQAGQVPDSTTEFDGELGEGPEGFE